MTAPLFDLLVTTGPAELPCQVADPEIFFAESPQVIEQAKLVCADCPIRVQCLEAALERKEPHGVWGGELFVNGIVVARKRPRGRPRKHPLPDERPTQAPAAPQAPAACREEAA